MSSEDIENILSRNEMDDKKTHEMNDNELHETNDNKLHETNDNKLHEMNDNKLHDNKLHKIGEDSHGAHKHSSSHSHAHEAHNKVVTIILIVLLVIMVGITFAPLGFDPENNVAKIAVLAPVSGQMEEFGIEYSRGVLIAAREINSQFRPFGKKYEVDIFNTNGSEADTLNQFVDIYNMNYEVVIGPITSNDLLAVAKYADMLDVVMISPSATTSNLPKGYKYVFRTVSPDDYLVYGVSAIIGSNEDFEKIMIIHTDDSYGNSISSTLEEDLKNHHKYVERVVVPGDEKEFDMNGIVQKMQTVRPDVVFVGMSNPAKFIELLQTVHDLGIQPQWIVTDSAITHEITNLGEVSEGILGVAPSNRISGNSYQRAYEEMYGSEMKIYNSVYGYETMKMLAAVIDSRGCKADAIRDGLEEVRYVGATGAIVFDEEGDRCPSYDVVQIQDGKWVTLPWNELMTFEAEAGHH